MTIFISFHCDQVLSLIDRSQDYTLEQKKIGAVLIFSSFAHQFNFLGRL